MSQKRMITVTYEVGGYTVRMTQEYYERFNRGHYRYVIERDGQIAYVGETIGGGFSNRISEAECQEVYRSFERWGKQEFEEVAG